MLNYNPFSLVSKTILVTGASSGIGRAVAIECSRLGAKLVITGRNIVRLQATFDLLEGEGHRRFPAELTSGDDLGKLVGACPELNGVAFCAGVNRAVPFAICKRDLTSEILDVNFSSPVELLRLLFKGGRIADASSMVFVSSIAASPGGTVPGNTVYAASKAALNAVMRHLAREFAVRRIRFNSVAPGMVNTPFVERMREKLTHEQIAADLSLYPLGRYGEPDDIAHGISYLLSDAASWMTGQQLVIDGGLTA